MKKVAYHRRATITVEPLAEKPYIAGQTAVILRILRPCQYPDNRFSDLWGDVQIARAWNAFAPGYPGNVSVQDALFLAHTFIRASAERMHFVTNDPALVGPTCDCALLRNGSGFQWLEKSRDTRSPGLALPRQKHK